MNYTPDISEYASLSWLHWSWFYDNILESKKLCIWLGPAHGVGQAFFSYILTDTGGFITRSLVIPIDEHELASDHMTKQFKNFMELLEAKIGNSKQTLFDGIDTERIYYSTFEYTDNADDNLLPYGEDIQYQK